MDTYCNSGLLRGGLQRFDNVCRKRLSQWVVELAPGYRGQLDSLVFGAKTVLYFLGVVFNGWQYRRFVAL